MRRIAGSTTGTAHVGVATRNDYTTTLAAPPPAVLPLPSMCFGHKFISFSRSRNFGVRYAF